ncbi:hypothetical protein [Lichenicoccus sp.]|uniref:hypothetical protein n=1 Tax=Lichenicoccus sp. TaxID=2781899 RepID=UPI003D0B4345
MSSLLDASSLLLDVLDAENAALRRLDLAAAVALVAAKQAALARFEAARPRTPPPHGSEPALGAAAIRLQAALAENRKLLERAMTVQGRIMALLARAAREQIPEQRYGSQGCYQSGRNDRPFALNWRA